jgi:nucleoid DNA-binding protein
MATKKKTVKKAGRPKGSTPKANAAMQQGAVITELSERTGISKTDIRHLLDELGDFLREEIQKGKKVKIGTLVQFEPKVRKGIKKGTMVMNPAAGEKVKHPGKPPSVKVTARVLTGLAKGDHLPSVQKVKKVSGK